MNVDVDANVDVNVSECRCVCTHGLIDAWMDVRMYASADACILACMHVIYVCMSQCIDIWCNYMYNCRICIYI